MRTFSRALARWDMLRAASITLAIAWLGVFAALIYAFTTGTPELSAVLGAISALAIAGAGFLYAWREPGA
ncbi:MAG TPA: hypothetical protein VIW26_00020 [Gemmatimonadales bacterium]|jgi:hypothetical protein